MGLDTYSSKQNLNYSGLNLYGGILSGTGRGGSFRGKVYADFVEEITGVSLYQEEIKNSVVKKMATRLFYYTKQMKENVIKSRWGFTKEEVQALTKWFRVTAEGGADIYGWW